MDQPAVCSAATQRCLIVYYQRPGLQTQFIPVHNRVNHQPAARVSNRPHQAVPGTKPWVTTGWSDS